jgi:hypothetical protein
MAILINVLEPICLIAGIGADSPERTKAAELVMRLYLNGYRTANELHAAIDRAARDQQSNWPMVYGIGNA